MDNYNKNKNDFLGMPYGTACNRLRKQILFSLLKETKKDICFQCGERIEKVNELSVEHKRPWLNENVELFWDLDNIAFSHLSCNCRESRGNKGSRAPHGTSSRYNYHGCRCDKCKKFRRDRSRRERINS